MSPTNQDPLCQDSAAYTRPSFHPSMVPDSQTMDESVRSRYTRLVSGVIVRNAEGRKWLQGKVGVPLAEDGRHDHNIALQLGKAVAAYCRDKGYHYIKCTAVFNPHERVIDILFITQEKHGNWLLSADAAEGVVHDGLKAAPTRYEETIRELLRSDFDINVEDLSSPHGFRGIYFR